MGGGGGGEGGIGESGSLFPFALLPLSSSNNQSTSVPGDSHQGISVFFLGWQMPRGEAT